MIKPVAIVAGVILSLPSPGQPTFSARTDVVRVDALVTQGGRPILGLVASDFTVLDNGIEQKVDSVSYDEIPLNAVVALDMSASVAGERLADLRHAATALIGRLRADEQAALATFSQEVQLVQPMTTEHRLVLERLQDLVGEGDTSLVDAAYLGLMSAETSELRRSMLIIFTDGSDTASWLTEDDVTALAKQLDVLVYAVVAGRTQTGFLRGLTDATGGRLLQVTRMSNLEAAFLSILAEARQRYVVTYQPNDGPSAGWHKLQIRMKRRGATVRARAGYFVAQQPGGPKALDEIR